MMGLGEVDMIEVPRVNTCDVILPTGIVPCITHTHRGETNPLMCPCIYTYVHKHACACI